MLRRSHFGTGVASLHDRADVASAFSFDLHGSHLARGAWRLGPTVGRRIYLILYAAWQICSVKS